VVEGYGMPVNPVTEITPEKKAKFLNALREWPNVSKAAKKAGMSRMSVYRIVKIDPEFEKQFKEAREMGIDALEDDTLESSNRSDTLRIFLLKGNRPEKYADRKHIDVEGKVTINFSYTTAKDDNPDKIT
jgi:hypothetical protein